MPKTPSNPKGAGRKRVLPDGSKRFCVTIVGPVLKAYLAEGNDAANLAKDVAKTFSQKYLQFPNQ